MNKTKSKVLSLVLASAMIVSSFSSLNFASAASTRENGRITVADDEIYLASNVKGDDGKDLTEELENLIGDVTLKTYDNETVSDADFVSFTHASGDRIIKSIKGDDNDVTLSKNAKGKEVITVTYEGEYDRDDKTVKVRGKKDITIYADPKGAQIIGKSGFTKPSDDRPDDVESASINDASTGFTVYKVENSGMFSSYTPDASAPSATVKKTATKSFDVEKDQSIVPSSGVYTIATKYVASDVADLNKADAAAAAGATSKIADDTKSVSDALAAINSIAGTDNQKAAADKVSAKAFTSSVTGSSKEAVDAAATAVNKLATTLGTATDKTISSLDETTTPKKSEYSADLAAAKAALAAANTALSDAKSSTAEKFASDGTINLEFKLKTGDATNADKTEKTTVKVSVDKKWHAENASVEINKKGSTTYITRTTGISWDSDSWKNVDKTKDVYAVSGYDIAAYESGTTANSILVTAGKVGAIKGNAYTTVNVDDGNVGDIKANKISVDDGSVGTLKQKGTDPEINITDGKIKAIDADAAKVTVTGGSVSGNVVGNTVFIDANDEDVATTISGDVEAKNDETPTVEIGSSSDAAVKVTGSVKGAVTLSDEFVTVGTVDADYENDITFEDFTGKIGKIINTHSVDVTVNGDSEVTLSGKLEASTLEIEDEDGKVTLGEGYFNTVTGDGTLAVPAGKLFVEDGIEDVTLQLTSGLAAGATAFQTYTDAVDVDDFKALGYTVEKKAVNNDVDKFVIKAVTFAGVQFDKTELSIAKGQSGTVSVSAYPTGTALPSGASIEWSVDANDDYIAVSTEGSVATIKVLDYNTDYATDNQATITATVVDANGNTYDDYVAASIKVTGTALPSSAVTVDTKTVNMGTGSVYQYIAKSSTGAVMTAASSDTQIATVELFNAADARGYKFQIKALAVGTATITTTDANGAAATTIVNVSKVNGTLKADTTSYTFAPGKAYDVKFSTTGTTAVPVVTVNGKVVSIAPRGNGVYRVTAQTAGTAYVVAKVGDTHVSVKFVVANGAASAGVKGNNVSNLK